MTLNLYAFSIICRTFSNCFLVPLPGTKPTCSSSISDKRKYFRRLLVMCSSILHGMFNQCYHSVIGAVGEPYFLCPNHRAEFTENIDTACWFSYPMAIFVEIFTIFRLFIINVSERKTHYAKNFKKFCCHMASKTNIFSYFILYNEFDFKQLQQKTSARLIALFCYI